MIVTHVISVFLGHVYQISGSFEETQKNGEFLVIPDPILTLFASVIKSRYTQEKIFSEDHVS